MPNFAAGGIATPADAALMMALGAESVFVGSGIFKSSEPARMAKAIVRATTHWQDPKIVAEVSRGLGERDARDRDLGHPGGRAAADPGLVMGAPFGVLALQGDFSAHAHAFRELGTSVREVRRVAELDGLSGLMIPGGESTTLLNLMQDEPWFEALRRFHGSGAVVAGTCAGAILLARDVSPAQPSLGLLGASIARNAFGRQVDSFEARLQAPRLGGALEGVFIRAPRFRSLDPEVEVLARYEGEPVLVQQGRVVAGTFHPELTASLTLHRYLAGLAERA